MERFSISIFIPYNAVNFVFFAHFQNVFRDFIEFFGALTAFPLIVFDNDTT